jgi:hypothetical protein
MLIINTLQYIDFDATAFLFKTTSSLWNTAKNIENERINFFPAVCFCAPDNAVNGIGFSCYSEPNKRPVEWISIYRRGKVACPG